MRNILLSIALFLPIVVMASDGVKNDAEVTGIVVYETSDNSTSIKIIINNLSKIGPNPNATGTDCELWSTSSSVYSAALTAKTTGKKVDVRYEARGDGDEFCKVRYMYIK